MYALLCSSEGLMLDKALILYKGFMFDKVLMYDLKGSGEQ